MIRIASRSFLSSPSPSLLVPIPIGTGADTKVSEIGPILFLGLDLIDPQSSDDFAVYDF